MSSRIRVLPLTKEAFAPYGDVIELEGQGGENYWDSDVATIVTDAAGEAKVSLFHCIQPVTLPFVVPKLEHHPLGSQAFIPCGRSRFVVVVGTPSEAPDLGALQAFISSGSQGINYHPGTWHTSLPSLDAGTYLVLSRRGPGENCTVSYLADGELILEE